MELAWKPQDALNSSNFSRKEARNSSICKVQSKTNTLGESTNILSDVNDAGNVQLDEIALLGDKYKDFNFSNCEKCFEEVNEVRSPT